MDRDNVFCQDEHCSEKSEVKYFYQYQYHLSSTLFPVLLTLSLSIQQLLYLIEEPQCPHAFISIQSSRVDGPKLKLVTTGHRISLLTEK